jgi:hypothetical protein
MPRITRRRAGGRLEQRPQEEAIVIALAHCYHCRLPSSGARAEYRELVARTWAQHGGGRHVSPRQFAETVHAEQLELIERMVLPDGTAKNTALLENVFVLLVCILNRMPVFLVGKPGCSKSLAMQLIFTNLRGKDSNDAWFKTLPQLYEWRYQCSEDSTSEGIQQVFDRATRFAEKNTRGAVAVVLLDEIGLAEVSRHNPLKVLHGLIEPDARLEFADGGAGADLPYAVVGISNWQLDAAKMNRAIVLSRPDPDADDLRRTAEAIMTSPSGRANRQSEGLLEPIAAAYYAYHLQQQREGIAFHGLRDFYALVKALGRSAGGATDLEVAAAVARNFGGLGDSVQTFQELLDLRLYRVLSIAPKRQPPSVLDLVVESLRDPRARHLMLITRGDAATCLLKLPQLQQALHEPVVMLASKFKEDLGDEHAYRQLSKIILYMQSGRQLLIKDHDHIYGAL